MQRKLLRPCIALHAHMDTRRASSTSASTALPPLTRAASLDSTSRVWPRSGAPTTPSADAQNDANAERLWTLSAGIAGMQG